MKPTEWINKILNYKTLNLVDFPVDKFIKSCIIYFKRHYGIFLLTDINGKYFTVKVNMIDLYGIGFEYATGLYLKQFANHIPNLLYPEDIYKGNTPLDYPLFNNPRQKLQEVSCKDVNITNIFPYEYANLVYHYYLTKACDYNLGYYFGKYGGSFTYDSFVGFVFQLLVGLQTMYRLGVYHGDMKPANILLCSSEIAKTNRIITYKYGDVKTWNISYDILNDTDLKIIDYGNSKVVDNIEDMFEAFNNEVIISLIGIIKIMWNKVINKQKGENYLNLLDRLKECNTNLVDVMLNAPIFGELENGNTGHIVELLTY